MKLFEKLDAAYNRNPDPDAIAKQLCAGGWIKCSDISEKFFEENKTIPYVIGCCYDDGSFSVVSGHTGGWQFPHCSGNYESFMDILTTHFDYWVIHYDDYVEGDSPCPA